jgi:pilus assembly protein Flp/PilA
MKNSALTVYVRMQALKFALRDESGQDMVEYALVMGLIAMGAVVSMQGLAASIGTGLTSIGTHVSTATS